MDWEGELCGTCMLTELDESAFNIVNGRLQRGKSFWDLSFESKESLVLRGFPEPTYLYG